MEIILDNECNASSLVSHHHLPCIFLSRNINLLVVPTHI